MAALRHFQNAFIASSGKRLFLFKNGESREVDLPTVAAPGEKSKQAKTSDPSTDSAGKNYALTSSFSSTGNYFAIADDAKFLHLFDAREWRVISTRPTSRRCTALTFTCSDSDILIADRSGDVYRFSVTEPGTDGELVLGHLSMVLDLAVTKDDRYIVTSDRDEKIRISHFPNAYNIHAFCLHHTQFVSQILYLSDLDCIVSGSGDGQICAWDVNGQLYQAVCCGVTCRRSQSQGQGSSNGAPSGDEKLVAEKETDTEVAGVKRMVYSPRVNLLAVIFHRSREVKLYSVIKKDNSVCLESPVVNNIPAESEMANIAETVTPSDAVTENMALDSDHTGSNRRRTSELFEQITEEPWDISFDDKGRLWVIQPCKHSTVCVYTCRHKDGELKISRADDNEDIRQVVETLNTNWDFFEASTSVPQLFEALEKMRIERTKCDNIREYQERKQERIQGKKLSQGDSVATSEIPPEKKTKIS